MIRLAACFLLASVPSCPDLYSLAAHGFEPPVLDGATAAAVPIPGGLLVTVMFTATNPNPFPIQLTSVDYQVAFAGHTVFTGTQEDPSVPEHGTSKLDLIGIVDPTDPAYASLRPGQAQTYTISGTAHVASPAGVPLDVDFEGTGSFVVPATLPTH